MTTIAPNPPADLAAIKTKQQAMWASGDFAVIGTTLQIVGELVLDGGRHRAEAEGLHVTFEVADAEALPYTDASFDVVLSTFGVNGPVHKVFAALDANGQAALETDLLTLLRGGARKSAAGLVVPAEYLETVITP